MEALWKRQTAAERSRYLRVLSPSGMSDGWAVVAAFCSGLTSRRAARSTGHRPSSRGLPASDSRQHLARADETEETLFACLDDEQREQLGALLVALRDGLAADTEGACSASAEAEPEA